MAWTCIYN